MTSEPAYLGNARSPAEDGDFVVLDTNDAKGYSGADLEQLKTEKINQILKWLSPTDYAAVSSEYGKHLQSHLTGTGDWVYETEQYRQWHDGNSGSLWVKAIAGAGKSVIAATTISKLANEGRQETPVLYFFFRHIVSANQKPQSLVRDYMAQLLLQSPVLQHNLFQLIDSNRLLESVSFDELWKILTSALTLLPRVYCVVDALDEMDSGNDSFLQDLVRLGNKKPDSIKLLMTSRPVPRVERTLRDASVTQIMLLQDSVDPEIAVYVQHRLDSYNGRDDARAKIYETMCSRANGHFLYARLMMDNLLDPASDHIRDENSMLRALEQLPTPMADMYTQMLLDHSKRSGVSQDLQILLLTWVTRAERPLRLLELSNIVSLEEIASVKDAKSVVREGCGPLLEILADETVCPIHHSFTEYLYDESRKQQADALQKFPVLDYRQNQRAMALSCLKFLVSGWHTSLTLYKPTYINPGKKLDGEKRQWLKLKHPFLDYAITHWNQHAKKYNGIDNAMTSALDCFMAKDINLLLVTREYLASGGHWSIPVSRTNLYQFDTRYQPTLEHMPVLMAAGAGLSHYLEYLINNSYSIDCHGDHHVTPISLAAAFGHRDTVALLLKSGAKNDEADVYGHKPLHHAAMRNHSQVVRLLLEAGVSCVTPKTEENPGRRCGNAPATRGTTPVQDACESGHVETVQEMIPYLSKEEIHAATAYAIGKGQTKAAMTLLEIPSVDVNKKHRDQSLLYLAAIALDVKVTKKLLDQGADVNVVSNHNSMIRRREYNPLQAFAASCGSRSTVRSAEDVKELFGYFIDAKLDVNMRDDSGGTILHSLFPQYAEDESRDWGWLLDALKFLAEKGLDLHSRRTSDGSSALHLSTSTSPEVVSWLIDQGLDVNEARITDGITPLMTIPEGQPLDEVVNLLISRGAKVNSTDRNGRSALHYVANQSIYDGCPEILVSAGANVNAQDSEGQSPIFLNRYLSEKNLRFLLNHGLDLGQKDRKGNTLLLHKINRGVTLEVFKALVEAGADARATNSQGSTVLHLLSQGVGRASRGSAVEMIRYFVGEGVDPLTVDNTGNNLWHVMAPTGSQYEQRLHLAAMNLLKELGVPPHAKNYLGQTPLHLAFSVNRDRYSYGLAEFLIHQCHADVNAADFNGIRPIHLASSFDFSSTCQLLELGADPTALTKEGQNCLMIACRTRACDTVSRLLEYLEQTGQEQIIDLKDRKGRTALHYACKSGRPESVELLLSAGANVNIKDNTGATPLHSCAEYQEEQKLWGYISPNARRQARPSDYYRPCGSKAAYVLSEDSARPSSSYADATYSIPHIRESIRLLVDYGADLSFLTIPPKRPVAAYMGFSPRQNPLESALGLNCKPMVSELLRIQEKLLQANRYVDEEECDQRAIALSDRQPRQKEKHPLSEQVMGVSEAWAAELQIFKNKEKMVKTEAMAKMIGGCFDTDRTPCSSARHDTIVSLLMQDDEILVEQLIEYEISFSKNHFKDNSIVFLLARNGFAGLMRKTGQQAAKMNASWVKEMESQDTVGKDRYKTILQAALLRELPNMSIVKFLVEDINFDINEQINGEYLVQILVSGHHQSRWWHTKALEYLIAHGLDIECLDLNGKTPLMRCILKHTDNHYDPVKIRMVEVLLEHGANPNATDTVGLTCLNMASRQESRQESIVKLLLKHNASPSFGRQPFIWDAVETQNIEALQTILESHPDLNVLPVPIEKQEPDTSRPYLKLKFRYLFEEAARRLSDPADSHPNIVSRAYKICQMLLDGGADINAKYEDGTVVLHNLICKKSVLDLVSTHPTFDVECTDAKGRTLILTACDTGHPSERLTAVSALLRHGPSLQVVDNSGRNALHCLLSGGSRIEAVMKGDNSTSYEYETAKNLLEHSSGANLASQADAEGRFPLHYALQSLKFGLIDLFISHGADPLIVDPRNGYTALHYLVQELVRHDDYKFNEKRKSGEEIPNLSFREQRSPKIHFSKFIKRGIDVNAIDARGDTPLLKLLDRTGQYWASEEYYVIVRALQYLEKKGANLRARNTSGESILHKLAKIETTYTRSLFERPQLAAGKKEFNFQSVFKWLVEKGVDVTWEDDQNRTCLDVAAAVGATWLLNLYKKKK